MNKEEYLGELRHRLKGINEKELEDAISYYDEYFEDAGIENEQQVMTDLGSPVKLAAQIRANATIQRQNERREGNRFYHNRPLKNIGVIALGIFALPIALPLAFAAVMLLFAFFLVIVSVFLALLVTVASSILVAIPLIINGCMNFATPGNACIAIGSGLILIAIGLLVFVGVFKLSEKLIPAFTGMFVSLYQKAKEGTHREKTEA